MAKVQLQPAGICMKGTISFRRDRGYYEVSWYHKGKRYKISTYKGQRLYSRKLAEKLLATMQADEEAGVFRIEKYTKERPTDVIPYLWQWLEAVKPTLKPATYKDYRNSIANHLVPFFKQHPFDLHEIQYDVLMMLLASIKRSGKGKMNVMYCLRACLDYAWRSGKIVAVPPFPKRSQYGIEEPEIQWLPEERQIAIIEAIEEYHQPIFWWLKLHFRRPGEACALHKVDFDGEVFTIRRTFSARKLVTRTKTGKVHIIPCSDDFRPHLKRMLEAQKRFNIISPFFFVNPWAHTRGKYYTNTTLNRIWKRACAKVGEDIPLYAGLKHSSCTQLLVEKGGTLSELQVLTDHARADSVRRYAKITVGVRKRLLRKAAVVRLKDYREAGDVDDA